MRRQTARLSTRSVRYLESGSGRPLLLLHAFPFDAEQWLPQLAQAPPGWRLVAFDARGFGATPLGVVGPEGVSMETYAADALELMAHLDMPRAVVCGLSMGGYVAMAMVRRAPARVGGLVLADTRAGADTAEGRAARDEMLDRLAREGPGAVARQMLPKLLAPATAREQPDLVEVVRRGIESGQPDGIAAAIRAMKSRPDSGPLLGQLACSALVIVGEQDALTPPSEASAMAEALPGARLEVLPDVGHLSNLENPGAFNRVLHAWLADLATEEPGPSRVAEGGRS